MNVAKYIKPIFHALTVASLLIAEIPATAIPQKYAIAVALGSASISAILHVLTVLYPGVAAEELDAKKAGQ